ncbi:MAG: hypothetical protein QXI58_01230 [Candidatus Micrarchaeia archaeon]
MATRGCVGVITGKTKNDWVGVYNHFDSYPEGLGIDLVQTIKKWLKGGKTLQEFCNELLKYSDWKHFKNHGLCPYCGKITTGTPEGASINLDLPPSEDTPKDIKRNLERYGLTDPFWNWHAHTDPDDKITPSRTVGLEYIYLIHPQKRVIYVNDRRFATVPEDPVRSKKAKEKAKIVWYKLDKKWLSDFAELVTQTFPEIQQVNPPNNVNLATVRIDDIRFRWRKEGKVWKLMFIDLGDLYYIETDRKTQGTEILNFSYEMYKRLGPARLLLQTAGKDIPKKTKHEILSQLRREISK